MADNLHWHRASIVILGGRACPWGADERFDVRAEIAIVTFLDMGGFSRNVAKPGSAMSVCAVGT